MVRAFLPSAGLILSACVAAGPVLAGQMPDTTAAPQLAAADVTALLAGNTMDAVTALKRFEGKVFHVHLETDGTLTIANFDGGTDIGVWEVTDDGHYCNQYANTRQKKRKCFTVHRATDGGSDGRFELRTASGALSSRFTVRQGNPDNL